MDLNDLSRHSRLLPTLPANECRLSVLLSRARDALWTQALTGVWGV
jgi:hypothetical protein